MSLPVEIAAFSVLNAPEANATQLMGSIAGLATHVRSALNRGTRSTSFHLLHLVTRHRGRLLFANHLRFRCLARGVCYDLNFGHCYVLLVSKVLFALHCLYAQQSAVPDLPRVSQTARHASAGSEPQAATPAPSALPMGPADPLR